MVDVSAAESAVRSLLMALGQDLNDENLRESPRRVVEMFTTQLSLEDPELESVFEEKFDELTLVRDIPFVSFCSHHLMPYFGRAHVGYIPRKCVLGVSKLARLVYSCCKGFTLQEAVTRTIADRLYESLDPLGTMVILEAMHSCMNLRGAKTVGASMVTSAVRGVFRDVPAARQEFMALVCKGGPR